MKKRLSFPREKARHSSLVRQSQNVDSGFGVKSGKTEAQTPFHSSRRSHHGGGEGEPLREAGSAGKGIYPQSWDLSSSPRMHLVEALGTLLPR